MLDAFRFPESLGDYEVVGRIGRGGVGYVLEVRSRATAATYAAKLIINVNDAIARERFRREAELLARCDRHPGVVKIHSFGETADGNLYMIMDLVQGEGLDRLLEREERLAPRRAAELGRDVALALGHAHSLGIVHRDVKPSNVLLDEAGSVRLTDFGLATACDLESLTRTGVFLGTVRYCAPEQAAGVAIDSATDVFATGCVLFHALTGRAPLEHLATPADVFVELSAPETLPDVRTLEPSCPEPLARIVACALAKDPDDRYPTGVELAADLSRFLAGKSLSDAARPAYLRRRGRHAIAAVLAVALTGALVVALRGLDRTIGARNALAASSEDVASARSILTRRVGAPTESELVFALEVSRRARERALAAASLGASGADEACRLADTSVRQATLALARRFLALGDTAAALGLLDALTGGPGESAPDERLDRARALFLEGRLDVSEAEATAALPLGARRAEALELVGDVFRAKGDFARAESAFAAALEVAAARQPDLRRKRGAAAALQGDDKVALAELAALVPDLALLPRSRAANAALADLAPALYRRGLAASLETCERDLDLASRLAAPTPALAGPVAARWLALAEPEARQWNTKMNTIGWDERRILDLSRPIARFGRAREADPTCDSVVLWESYEMVRSWALNTGQGSEFRTRIARGLLEASPHDPFLLFLVASSLRVHVSDAPLNLTPERALARRDETLALTVEAIDRYPRFRVAEPEVISAVAFTLAVIFVDLLAEMERELDTARLHRIADRGEATDSFYWYFVARYHRTRHEGREALEALDRQPIGARLPSAKLIVTERILALVQERRAEEAVSLARQIPQDTDGHTKNILMACLGIEEKLGAAPATSADAPTILALGKIYALLGRVADAEEALARLKRLGAEAEAAKLAPLIEQAKRSGG